MKEKTLSVPCVNLCVHCGKDLNREEKPNREVRKEHAKIAMKEKTLSVPCVTLSVHCGKNLNREEKT